MFPGWRPDSPWAGDPGKLRRPGIPTSFSRSRQQGLATRFSSLKYFEMNKARHKARQSRLCKVNATPRANFNFPQRIASALPVPHPFCGFNSTARHRRARTSRLSCGPQPVVSLSKACTTWYDMSDGMKCVEVTIDQSWWVLCFCLKATPRRTGKDAKQLQPSLPRKAWAELKPPKAVTELQPNTSQPGKLAKNEPLAAGCLWYSIMEWLHLLLVQAGSSPTVTWKAGRWVLPWIASNYKLRLWPIDCDRLRMLKRVWHGCMSLFLNVLSRHHLLTRSVNGSQ